MESSISDARSVALVIGGGPVRGPDREFDAVIAADSGLDVALAAGFHPTHLVGDFDSISADGLRWAEANGVPVERHPTDKDATDTALALVKATELGAHHLVLFGGVGIDRFDHLIGTMVALGDPALSNLQSITAHLGASTVSVVHPRRSVTLDLPRGHVFSLVSMHGACRGVEVLDVRWPLRDATLDIGTTRGVSNESLGRHIHISCTAGVLTIIVPRPSADLTATVAAASTERS